MTLRGLEYSQIQLMLQSCEASSEEEFLVLCDLNNSVAGSMMVMAFKVRSFPA